MINRSQDVLDKSSRDDRSMAYVKDSLSEQRLSQAKRPHPLTRQKSLQIGFKQNRSFKNMLGEPVLQAWQ